jgi:glyoxylase-like metal-dependent hydrolase (beta-lactamase superfamily II)
MTTVIPGAGGGRYPDGNALLVRGTSATILIDPTLTIADAANPPDGIDRVLISHCHEDHLAGLFKYSNVPVHVHADDLLGLQSLGGLMTIYGLPPSIEAAWRDEVVMKFHYAPRPDALSFTDGDVFDLGGATLQVIHLPGHTRGHSGFLVEPDGVMFLADIDLTGFGPYYGDAWSSLDAFERSLERCRQIEAGTYVTFHHRGVVAGRAALLALLDDYEAVIARRDHAMLDFLAEPHSLDEMMARRFIYRPHVKLLFADAVERRSAELHVERLLTRGHVVEVEAGRYQRRSPIFPTL